MAAILSIDFDYFVAASAHEREEYFLRGGEDIPREQLPNLWTQRYAEHPQLESIGVVQQFYVVRNLLASLELKPSQVFVSETHRAIKEVVDALPRGTQLRIVNVDFHHDYYHYFTQGGYCNCGNWLRRVMEERPDTKVTWIRREDSQIATLEGDFPFEHTTELSCLFEEKFTCVFLCRSPEWSPPHLTKRYKELVLALIKPHPAPIPRGA